MVEALGHDRYRVSDGPAQWLLYAVKTADATWVFFDGRVYVESRRAGPVGPADTEAQRPARDEGIALASPMPATVLSIHVAPGQDVQRDDLLVMLEAMKMELPIKAPRDGRIKAIACTQGDLVQPGVQLIELD